MPERIRQSHGYERTSQDCPPRFQQLDLAPATTCEKPIPHAIINIDIDEQRLPENEARECIIKREDVPHSLRLARTTRLPKIIEAIEHGCLLALLAVAGINFGIFDSWNFGRVERIQHLKRLRD